MITATHLHAMVIHFPIALLIIGFFFALVSIFSKNTFFRTASIWLLFIGTIGTTIAFLSGDAAGEGIEGGLLALAVEEHEESAELTLWLAWSVTFIFMITEILKNRFVWLRVIGIIVFAACITSLSRTGYLGGHLVYQHGAGVEVASSFGTTTGQQSGDND